MPVEGAAQGSTTGKRRALLFHAVGMRRYVGAQSSWTLRCGAPTGWTRSEPDSGDHRQPERQGLSKRGSTLDPQGFNAGKKVTGRKRQILVDTLGLLLSVAVHPANIQDRDSVALVLNQRTRRLFPFIESIFADGGYQGQKDAAATARTGTWKIEIVERSDTAVGFKIVRKRWIVERTIAWISRFRRLARDFERYARTVAAFIRLAMVRIMLRRLTRSNPCRRIRTP